MADPILDHLDQLAADCGLASEILFCSDFDGTLVPIQDHPDHCILHLELRDVISELACGDFVRVAIVSGRSLADLRARVGVGHTAYAGNHGLEIDTPTTTFRHPEALAARSALNQVVFALRRELETTTGVWVEHKGLSASVHYRQVEAAQVQQVLEAIDRIVAESDDAGLFTLRTGKAVREVRPAVVWNKGSAVRWLANHWFPTGEPPLVIYLGDDDTDEDAFGESITGISILVGHRPFTAARYTLRDPNDVRHFADWFVSIAREKRKARRSVIVAN